MQVFRHDHQWPASRGSAEPIDARGEKPGTSFIERYCQWRQRFCTRQIEHLDGQREDIVGTHSCRFERAFQP